ncbi:hypothetical protein [Olivibacter sitiensis]|uniref:hypothetical protein n=1 Tax=Olivibacter sitiensis TaxID=376470 RepID=UPI0004899A5A|nr:hypothetical protein [Olivibacter sitiensis]
MKNIILCLSMVFCFRASYAQTDQKEQSFKNITLNAGIDTAFDKTANYIQASDMFILAMDKQAGFIQAKVFEKNRKMISAKRGERKTYNFILRPLDDKTTVSLNIYVEDYLFGGEVQSRSYYYEEKGISKNERDYRAILKALQDAVQE